MNNGRTNFTVYALDTGEVLRSGYCSAKDLQYQAREGQGVLAGVKGHDVDDRVITPANAAQPYLRRRSKADCATRRQRPPEDGGQASPADPLAVLVEVFRAKGIEISQADLAAATASLQARRTVDARG